MDLFAHRLMDSIEIVGDPLRERELVANCPVVFFHSSYFGFFMTNKKIKMSKTSRLSCLMTTSDQLQDLAVYHLDSPGLALISSGWGPISACKCLNRREWRPLRRKLFSEYV